jgi:hypothetical protein
VHDLYLTRVDAELAAEPQGARPERLAFEGTVVAELEAGPVDRRPDPGRPRRHDESRARVEELVARAVRHETESRLEIGSTERQGRHGRMLGQRVCVTHRGRVLHERDERDAQARCTLDGRRARLRDDNSHRGADARHFLQVTWPVLSGQIVDADQPHGSPGRLDEARDHCARLLLGALGDAILEVEDDGIRAARERTATLPVVVPGEDQERPRESEPGCEIHPTIMSDI